MIKEIFVASTANQVPRPFIAVHGSDLSEIVQSIRKEAERQSAHGYTHNAKRLDLIADSFAVALRASGVWSSPVKREVSEPEENPSSD